MVRNKKKRVRVDNAIQDELAYRSKNICCACEKQNKPLQIHHINGDRTCNNIDNLALICLECHNQTLIRGGFAQQLTGSKVKKFRDELYKRVQKIRELVDKKTIDAMLGMENIESLLDKIAETGLFERDNHKLSCFILSIPLRYKLIQKQAQPFYDKGSTPDIRLGIETEIAGLEHIIDELKTFYPEEHFDGGEFVECDINMLIWDYAYKLAAPFGMQESGTSLHIDAGMVMISFFKFIINKLVGSLLPYEESYTGGEWRKIRFNL